VWVDVGVEALKQMRVAILLWTVAIENVGAYVVCVRVSHYIPVGNISAPVVV